MFQGQRFGGGFRGELQAYGCDANKVYGSIALVV